MYWYEMVRYTFLVRISIVFRKLKFNEIKIQYIIRNESAAQNIYANPNKAIVSPEQLHVLRISFLLAHMHQSKNRLESILP